MSADRLLPPLLRDRSTPVAAVLAGVVPVTFGAVTGLALDRSPVVYLVLLAVAGVGGVGAGIEHDSTMGGLRRGLVGGALFTTGILVTHLLINGAHEDQLPSPRILLYVLNCGVGALFGVLGTRLRARLAG
ncbi:hypothetical protein [Luteipulveratus mongoliensis]|uniref:TIGR04086 family membrane protein n=1 Tax=Luteipulveratus mongoliensis TaxID=571913 RepID=A0A0K1JJR3_9MICO|nr:hypothetical protein [Luteipulveratus mongoliensis]AKU16823.1 hypothetical protein VV02_14680 [Luteipulveratus mongoliensis]